MELHLHLETEFIFAVHIVVSIREQSFIFFWENFHQITKKAQNHVKIG